MKTIIHALLLVLGLLPGTVQAQVLWSRDDALQLLAHVDQASSEGLDPADYDSASLRRDLAAGFGWDARASDIFLHLAADLYQGHVRNRADVAWYLLGATMGESQRLDLLERALSTHTVRQTLQDIAPKHRQYVLLKAALAATPPNDTAAIRSIRANLERWRWMPRDLGTRHLLVNVPAFTVTLIDGARIVSRRVIVGKPVTPTPQFSATVTGAIFNPWWDVPDSIVRESVGRLVLTQPALARQRGYMVAGGRYRQRPGPSNALGQAKLVMANPYRVYLHDTPTKALFDQPVRAFSHGCIRTQDVVGLTRELLEGTAGWTGETIDRALAEGRTVQADLARPLPIYVVYFTVVAGEDGRLTSYPDIYRRDAAIVAGLIDRESQ